MMEIPLFPLNTVLFPGMPLQLHIFEERYKQMLHDCQKADSRFGVALIRHGEEANGPLPVPYSIGCIAHITSTEALSQGQFNLWAVGRERIQLLELRYNHPYLVGLAQEFPLQLKEPLEVNQSMQLLQPLLERYIRTLSRNEQVDELVKEIPIDPISFAYLGAVLLQVSPIQKQSFLEIRNCIDLLEKLRTNYRREVALAESVLENQAPATQGSFSLN